MKVSYVVFSEYKFERPLTISEKAGEEPRGFDFLVAIEFFDAVVLVDFRGIIRTPN